MSALFHKETTPRIILPPKKEDEAVQETARREAEAIRRRKGYASTIATGPEGVTNPPTTLKTQLG